MKKKPKIKIKNGLKDKIGTILGEADTKTGKIQINVKAHKGDKRALASTVKHEIMHVKHPKMTEKQVYKRTAKTKIPPQEESKLLAKLRHKRMNYKIGAAKRKFKLGRVQTKPGELISNMNAQKVAKNKGKTIVPSEAVIMSAI